MPNFIEIGGVTRKPLVDLTRNDPYVEKSPSVKADTIDPIGMRTLPPHPPRAELFSVPLSKPCR